MLVFGVDIPLVEIMLVFSIIIFVLLVEAIFVIMMQMKHLNKAKKMAELIGKLSETVLAIKAKEIEQLDKLKGR
ncbi:hypothetical protein HOD05_03795 [Candidatus Woesearchaeota archaeon]|jgi:cell division protein FtsL|nr:hypothetical protein [Candidatus Woesearchaeota archaeon]MBT4150676.1 hypothetical protein [Candidatus Woesearchaeota archaeon]MBT4247894.1 hypothetical protein [Candidatus Woesearchaeota archaeon]MBT4434318.1 hypothetical protein [Candidatus Woesearchaeota archaeon]MBT7332293.1 hypothetical protein [Candidatus Woesearchaeota archaeon]